jgi:TetR/AcrR family transcriptional repressor of nem operon
MKVSREQAAENRQRIVEVAARLFRERGFDGVGVADLMKTAGLTHGGFYGHFRSKEALMAEACEQAISTTGRHWKATLAASESPALEALAEGYLSTNHRDNPGNGCVIAALANDAARQAPPVRQVYTRSVKRFIDTLSQALPGRAEADRRQQAVAACASMVGALILARAIDDDALSQEFLDAVAAQLPHTNRADSGTGSH